MTAGEVLVDVLVVLLTAKLATEVAERVRLPAVVGEIVAGVMIGPSVLHLVGDDAVLRVLGELGVILLLLEVGLQMDLAGMGAVGRASLLVAGIGVAAPFALGWAVSGALGHGGDTALFIGAALTATSVGITARVFGDLRALASPEARIVLGAAVADDVIGLVLLTVIVRLVGGGSVSAPLVAGVVALALLFLVVGGGLGLRLAPPLFGGVHRLARSPGTLVAVALAFALGFSELARLAGLAPIIGAFVAGLSLARSEHAERIRRELTPVGHLLVPVFFLQIGIDARVDRFARPEVLALAAALLAAAVVGKLVSPLGAGRASGDRLIIGLGMIPRGEVGLIFATLGLRSGVLDDDLYAALLLVVLASTLVTPPLLRWRLVRVRRRAAAAAGGPMPEGGWLTERDETVELAGDPPAHLVLPLALEAARRVATKGAGPRLLAWLGAQADEPMPWDRSATAQLLVLLREGTVRSWRFLETAGVLDRALPELAGDLRRRRSDPFELDPTAAVRWHLLDRVRQPDDAFIADEVSRLERPEWLLLAALVIDTAGEGADHVQAARRLVQRLDLGAGAEVEVALLVGDGGLLRAAARRPDATGEASVLQLAAHFDQAERARAAYVLSLALGELESWERELLVELHERVQAALAQPELTGRQARNLIGRRRAEAARLVGVGPAVARVEAAPHAYVTDVAPADLARQARLLEPLPPRRSARVEITPFPDGGWRIDVACRDQPGLLSAIAGVLTGHDLAIHSAAAATWPDGGVIESFAVVGPCAPDAAALTTAAEAALGRRLRTEPVSGAVVTFDDESSPWWTRCEVRAPDRPGLLHALAAALACAGADVHGAQVSTSGDTAVDHFEVTDRRGEKLGEREKAAVRQALASGGPRRARGAGRAHRARRVATEPKHVGNKPETQAP